MKKKPHHFRGITVFVPEVLNLIPVEKAIPARIKPGNTPFQVIRLVGNIVFYDRDDQAQTHPIQKFNPPIELRVGYKTEDIMQNNGHLDSLKLAYWDGNDWVIISDPAHEYQILPPSTGQVAEVKISEWVGDPPIAWGR